MTLAVSFCYVFLFSLLCCKYIRDIYLSMLDFNCFFKILSASLTASLRHIYVQDHRRHSVAMTQRRNDHVQVCFHIK